MPTLSPSGYSADIIVNEYVASGVYIYPEASQYISATGYSIGAGFGTTYFRMQSHLYWNFGGLPLVVPSGKSTSVAFGNQPPIQPTAHYPAGPIQMVE